jgi:hypothetical protein
MAKQGLALTARQLAQLKRLPRTHETWIGARRSFETEMIDGPADICLWLETSSGAIRSVCVVPDAVDKSMLAEELVDAMLEPQESSCKPSVPRRVEVADKETARLLSAFVEPLGVEVRVASHDDLLDGIVAALQEEEGEESGDDELEESEDIPVWDYLEQPDTQPEQLRELFDHAVSLHENVAWWDVAAATWQLDGIASGPVLARFIEDDEGEQGIGFMSEDGRNLLISFVAVERLAPEQIALYRVHRWKCAHSAHLPMTMVVLAPGQAELPEADDINMLTAALAALHRADLSLAEPQVMRLKIGRATRSITLQQVRATPARKSKAPPSKKAPAKPSKPGKPGARKNSAAVSSAPKKGRRAK